MITDLNERYSLEIQITEFGQVPKQLFRYSHPRRCSNLNVKDIFSDDYDSTKSNIKTKEWKLDGSFEIYADYQLHKECVNAVRFSNDGRKLFSISQDNLLKIYSVEEKKQIQSINISNMALSSMVVLPDEKTIIVGSWDNYIYIYDVEFGKQVFNTIAHDDAISEIKWNDDILITCSTDSTIKIWKYDKRLSSKPLRLMNDLDFEVPVYCVAPNSTNTLLLVGTEDGQVLLLDMKTKSRISQQQVCDDSVRVVAFSLNDERFVCCGGSVIKMFDVSTSSEIFHKDTGEEIRCIKWDGTILIAGCSSGNLMVWNLNNSCLINSHKGHVGPILCVDVYDGHRVATGGKDKKVVVWDVL